MQTVTVKKELLLKTIKQNREKHLAEYTSARKIFIEDAIEKLQEMLTVAQTKGKIIQSLGLIEPQSYVASYDTAIKMLEFSVDDTVELTQQEFTQFVEDNFGWKNSFTASTSIYTAKLAK